MTGSPLFRLGLVIAVLALLFIPVSRITGRLAPSAPAPTTPSPSTTLPTELHFTFTSPTPPTRIAILAAGQPLLEFAPTAAESQQSLTYPLPTAGVDLILSATWDQENAPHALRVRITRDDGQSLLDQTFWAEGSLQEVIALDPPPSP